MCSRFFSGSEQTLQMEFYIFLDFLQISWWDMVKYSFHVLSSLLGSWSFYLYRHVFFRINFKVASWLEISLWNPEILRYLVWREQPRHQRKGALGPSPSDGATPRSEDFHLRDEHLRFARTKFHPVKRCLDSSKLAGNGSICSLGWNSVNDCIGPKVHWCLKPTW